jgi:transposase
VQRARIIKRSRVHARSEKIAVRRCSGLVGSANYFPPNPNNKHVVDLLAEEKNMMVLRLPPYHCELNPIELVWAFIKNDVAANNTTFKFSDVKILFQQALAKVLPEHWKNNITHVKKVDSQMWEIDNLTDSTIEEIIINIVSDSSSTERSDDEKEN